MKLILKSEEDASSIDDAIAGAMEVLEDDNEQELDKYNDYTALWKLIFKPPIKIIQIRDYPHVIDMDGVSEGQSILLAEVMQNCRDSFSNFTATLE